MASQPVDSGDMWTSVSGGVGTAVLKDMKASLVRVVVPGTYVGTINFHDASTAAGTTATSQILSLGIPATSVPFDLEVGANCKNGLVYQATGTPVVTVIWK